MGPGCQVSNAATGTAQVPEFHFPAHPTSIDTGVRKVISIGKGGPPDLDGKTL